MNFFNAGKTPDCTLHVFGHETLVDFEQQRWAIRTDDVPRLLGRQRIPIVFLQPGVVAHGISGGEEVLFVHQKPVRRSIHLSLPTAHSFTVQWPDLVFGLTRVPDGFFSSRLRVWTFSGPLTPETPLAIPPLPNVSPDGSLCFGDIQPPQTRDPQIFTESVFFKTVFTHASMSFPVIQTSLAEYLRNHKATGWNIEDLPVYGTLQQAMERWS